MRSVAVFAPRWPIFGASKLIVTLAPQSDNTKNKNNIARRTTTTTLAHQKPNKPTETPPTQTIARSVVASMAGHYIAATDSPGLLVAGNRVHQKGVLPISISRWVTAL